MSSRTTRSRAAARKRGGLRTVCRHGVPPEVEAAYAGKLGALHPDCKSLSREARAKGQGLWRLCDRRPPIQICPASNCLSFPRLGRKRRPTVT